MLMMRKVAVFMPPLLLVLAFCGALIIGSAHAGRCPPTIFLGMRRVEGEGPLPWDANQGCGGGERENLLGEEAGI